METLLHIYFEGQGLVGFYIIIPIYFKRQRLLGFILFCVQFIYNLSNCKIGHGPTYNSNIVIYVKKFGSKEGFFGCKYKWFWVTLTFKFFDKTSCSFA